MNKMIAVLALVALVCSATLAHGHAGRTTADDCKAGSADPDCPDEPAPGGKPGAPKPPPKASLRN